MKSTIYQFCIDEQGQDLIEYTLLLAFVALGTAGLMTKAGSSTKTIWTAANTTLANAVAAATS